MNNLTPYEFLRRVLTDERLIQASQAIRNDTPGTLEQLGITDEKEKKEFKQIFDLMCSGAALQTEQGKHLALQQQTQQKQNNPQSNKTQNTNNSSQTTSKKTTGPTTQTSSQKNYSYAYLIFYGFLALIFLSAIFSIFKGKSIFTSINKLNKILDKSRK